MMLRFRAAVALALLAISTGAFAQGTAKPKSSLNAEISSQFPDQSASAITPQVLRNVTNDMVASSQQYAGVNAQVGTSYTVQLSDYGQFVTFNNGSAVAVTLPAASTAGFIPFSFYAGSLGAGTVTITPAAGTIGGSASLALTLNQGVFIVSDGTNWQVVRGFGVGTLNSVGLTMPSCFAVAGSPVTGSTGTFIVTTNGTQGGIPWFSSATNCGSSAALTQFGIMYGGGTGGPPAATAAATNGQVWLGQTGAAPAPTTLSGDVASVSAGGVWVNGKVNGVSQPSSGTSGGIKYFNSTSSELSSALLTANAFMIGGGAGGAPSTVAITGLVLGNGASAPTAYGGATCTNQFVRALSAAGAAACNTVSLTADVTGTLPIANGGSSQTTAPTARGPSGFNIDQATSTGDANYTILSTDRMVYHTALSAARTDTLPAANSVNAGQEFHISDFRGVASGTFTVTLQRAGADTINGVTSVVAIGAQYGAGIFWSDGVSRWTFFPASTGGGSGTVTQVVCDGVTITGTGTCPPRFGFANCTLTSTVAGNNVTFALKDNAGADPSASSPCNVWFPSNTPAPAAASAIWVQRTVTAATSFTANAGSTFGITNTTAQCAAASSCPFRLWVTLVDNGSTAVLGAIAVTNSSGTLGLDETTQWTSTACSACGTATALGTLYTTAAVTSKSIQILGYAEWGTGLATAGTYASGATIIRTFGPGVKKPGDVVQTTLVRGTPGATDAAGNMPGLSATLPTQSNGTQFISKAVTVRSAANVIKMHGAFTLAASAAVILQGALFQDSGTCLSSTTQNSLTGIVGSAQPWNMTLDYMGTAGVAGSSTFKLRAGGSAASTVYFGGNGGSQASTDNEILEITEIQG